MRPLFNLPEDDQQLRAAEQPAAVSPDSFACAVASETSHAD